MVLVPQGNKYKEYIPLTQGFKTLVDAALFYYKDYATLKPLRPNERLGLSR